MLKNFATLYQLLLVKQDQLVRSYALKSFFDQSSDEDSWMALRLLNGYKIKSSIRKTDLTLWFIEYSDLPEWLIMECHAVAGDWAETFSLAIGNTHILTSGLNLYDFILQLEQHKSSGTELKEYVKGMWSILSPAELYLFHKLLLGLYKPVKENNFLTKFISQQYNIDLALVKKRLNNLSDLPSVFKTLVDPVWSAEERLARPYIFNFPVASTQDFYTLGEPENWYVESFISGLRAQLVRRSEEIFLWSDDFNLITRQFDNAIQQFHNLPAGTVLDLIIQSTDVPQENKNKPSSQNASPTQGSIVILDIMEWEFEDIRSESLQIRKRIADELVFNLSDPDIIAIPYRPVINWGDFIPGAQPSGSVFKRVHDGYDPNQTTWWRYKPKNQEWYMVLMYAEVIPRQAQGYLCTFGIYNEQQILLPVVKCSTQDLSEVEVTQLHYWIQNNFVQRFGPVRVVRQQQVFLIAFDKAIKNRRLKAGYTLKNAQIKKWNSVNSATHKIGNLEDLKNVE